MEFIILWTFSQSWVLKDKEGKQQTDIFGVIYTYRCILTNNWMSTEKDIITFYNEREASEKNFDIQNNDFGWSHLPFSFMAENMVFMMVTATSISISSVISAIRSSH